MLEVRSKRDSSNLSLNYVTFMDQVEGVDSYALTATAIGVDPYALTATAIILTYLIQHVYDDGSMQSFVYA